MRFLRRALHPAEWSLPVWVVIGLLGVIMSSYAWIVSSPAGDTPDEGFHLTAIWCPDPIEKYCPVVENTAAGRAEVFVPQTVALAPDCYLQRPRESASCVYALSDTVQTGSFKYNKGMYPGTYYHVMHLFVTSDVNRSVLTMRWVNTGLAALLFGALFFLADPGGRRLVAYTTLGTAVPLVIYFTTSINPTGWGITGVVAAWMGVHLALSTTSTRRQWALMGVGVMGALVAASARADAAAFAVLVTGGAALWHWRKVLHRLRLVVPLLIVGLLGIWGWFSGYQHGAALHGMRTDTAPGDPVRVFAFNLFYVPHWLAGFWGFAMSWLDTPVPNITVVLAATVTIGLCYHGLLRSKIKPSQALVIIGVGAATIGTPLLILQENLTHLPWDVQVRYLAPLIVVFVGTCLAAREGGPPRLPGLGAFVFVVFTTVANAYALYTLIQRFTAGQRNAGTETTWLNLSIGATWWRAGGPGPTKTWAIGSLGFALMALIIFHLSTRPKPVKEPDDKTLAPEPEKSELEKSEPEEQEPAKQEPAEQEPVAKAGKQPLFMW